MSTVAAIAAVVGAYPVIKNALPMKLSKKEEDIIRLAVMNDNYPCTLLFVVGGGRPYVQSPFRHETNIKVTSEITTLLSKGLINIIQIQQENSYIGTHKFIWLLLSEKGLRVAYRIKGTKKVTCLNIIAWLCFLLDKNIFIARNLRVWCYFYLSASNYCLS